ncbi:RNA polymerase sigma factor (sigma-70 family) [Agromyces terreus]|uniref:RNA polymerase sigma factor (Sigma-70 family) n=1 Tax=Agromyces terreus TaxID=424795 RepID=A0A9X2H5Y5_9MICO|nr:sigma-70 family RNA polymerase sigma factor [Agromyces terreus]MCP2371402.1 RNA polymerase sigma factor (sigma-70 family) [Agromyces terreus]
MARSWDDVATQLVVERGDALTRYAYLLTGDADDAADLVQDALVRTFGSPRFQLTLPRAEAYVRRAVLNAVIDRSRRDGTWRRVRHLAVAPAPVDVPQDRSDVRIDLMRRIRSLAPRQAACIVLRYYDDLTVDQVARTLGLSSGAVKRYLSDGLRALSSSIEASDGATVGADPNRTEDDHVS